MLPKSIPKEIIYEHHMITVEEFKSQEIWKGWQSEPWTKKFEVPTEAISQAFPISNNNMCITAFDHNHEILGHSNANNYSDYRQEAPVRFEALSKYPHIGTQKWASIWLELDDREKRMVVLFFEGAGIPLNKVAHRSGLMVMPHVTKSAYEKSGLDDPKIRYKLVIESHKLLRSQGFKYVFVTPSHIGSRLIFLKMGYKPIPGFALDLDTFFGTTNEFNDYFEGLVYNLEDMELDIRVLQELSLSA